MVRLLGAYWIVVCLVGVFCFVAIPDLDNTFYDLRADDSLYVSSVLAHVFAALSLFFGFFSFVKKKNFVPLGMEKITQDALFHLSGRLYLIGVVSITTISVSAYLASFGWSDLVRRDYYLADNDSVLPVIAQLTSIIGIVAASMLIASHSIASRYIGAICAVCLTIFMFGKGSRFAVFGVAAVGVSPMFSWGGAYLRSFRWPFAIVWLLLCLPLIHALIYFRAFGEYGIEPYLTRLPEALSAFSDDGYKFFWLLLGNLAFSLPVTEVTISMHHSFEHMFVELNPLPGSLVGWANIGPTRRISLEVPYSLIGELYGYSPFLLLGYMWVVGYIFAWVESLYSEIVHEFRAVYFMVYCAFSLLFGMLALQYNLRDGTRIIYYMLLLCCLIYFISSTQKGRRALL